MRVEIKPGKAEGKIAAPPSKSAAHRILIACGLAEGESVIDGISHSEDMHATMDCLSALGVGCRRDGDVVRIKGINPKDFANTDVLNCRESGSTLRFFIPLCLLNNKEYTLKGSKKLFSRPLDVYEKICKEQNIKFELGKDSLKVCGKLKSGVYEVAGNISSQFITGLMFALSLCGEECIIKLIPPVESRSYIDLSMQILNEFGMDIYYRNENTLVISGGGRFRCSEYKVEGDYSNAAFFEALNCLGNDIEITGLREDSIQGDKIYREYFPKIQKEHESIDLSDCPDLGPVIFALSAAKGGGRFCGTARLKIKESDRIQAMADELIKFGAELIEEDDSVQIISKDFHKPNCALWGHNDHRIVMAMSVLCTLTGGVIEGAEAVSKSFPDYFEKLKELGFEVNCYVD